MAEALAPIPTTREEAIAAGRAAVESGKARMYDLTGYMQSIGIPNALRTAYLVGIEDALEADGIDTDPDSDGYAAERRALAGLA